MAKRGFSESHVGQPVTLLKVRHNWLLKSRTQKQAKRRLGWLDDATNGSVQRQRRQEHGPHPKRAQLVVADDRRGNQSARRVQQQARVVNGEATG